MTDRIRCTICKHYENQNMFGDDSWCQSKNCYIARPNNHACNSFDYSFWRKLVIRINKVRRMMSKWGK
jgi:hypothetical protein